MPANYIADKQKIEQHLRTAYTAGGIQGIVKMLNNPATGVFSPPQLASLRTNGRIGEFIAPLENGTPFNNWIEASAAAAAVCRPAYTGPVYAANKMANNDLIPNDPDAKEIHYA